MSGGEPMARPVFARPDAGGEGRGGSHLPRHVPERAIRPLPRHDAVRRPGCFDIKETGPARHEDYTGVGAELMRENLQKLDELGSEIVLRCPIVPGLNN